jgi:uncharacterized zinc-type alcohol dehydrogenase-like protein
MVDSCRTCPSCQEGLEQYCEVGMVGTYNGRERSGSPTYGGYSNQIVVDENYVLTRVGQARPGSGGPTALRRHHHLLAPAAVEGGPRATAWA